MAKNSFGWPKNRFIFVRNVAAALAPPNLSVNGRMMAQWGRFGLRNSHGTGKIRLGWKSGPMVKKLGNVRPVSETGATGGCTPLPAKSTHSRKCATSSPPMPIVTSSASSWVTLRVETRIQAGTTLFNCSEVECRGIRDHLNVVGALEISIRYWNRSSIGDGDGLRKCGA